MKLATFQAQHFAGIEALWEEAFPEDPPWNAARVAIPEKRALQPDLIIVALSSASPNADVVGSIIAGYDGHRGWLYALAVAPKHRRNGIGTKLVAEAQNRLAHLGCKKINLQVRTTNAGVIEFYERLGFAIEERVSMGKRLNQ